MPRYYRSVICKSMPVFYIYNILLIRPGLSLLHANYFCTVNIYLLLVICANRLHVMFMSLN